LGGLSAGSRKKNAQFAVTPPEAPGGAAVSRRRRLGPWLVPLVLRRHAFIDRMGP